MFFMRQTLQENDFVPMGYNFAGQYGNIAIWKEANYGRFQYYKTCIGDGSS